MPRSLRSTSNGSKPKSMKQTTLFGHIVRSSSPDAPLSPPRKKRAAAPTQRTQRATQPAQPSALSDGALDDDENMRKIQFEPSSPAVIELTDTEPDENDGHESDSPQRPKALKRNRTGSRIYSDTEMGSRSYEEEEVPQPRRRLTRGSAGDRKRVRDSDEEDEEEEVASPPKKLIKGARPPTPDEDLADELDQDKVIEPRMRNRSKKSKYLENLEKLKRRKLGHSSPVEESEDEQQSDASGSDPNSARPFAGARPSNPDGTDSEQEEQDSEDDGFIVEDADAPVAELPAAFSMGTHQDLSHHFKTICQFFVHAAVLKPKKRRAFVEDALKNEEYFSVPLQVTRRKLLGIRDSAVAGSTWKPEFRRALERYPGFELFQLEYAVPYCDACNLGGRRSTRSGHISGSPYDPLTFENVEEADDEDSDDDEEEASMKKKIVDLGRFCARRVLAFHKFSHWEHSLYRSLAEEIEAARRGQKGGFVQVAYLGGKQPPEDLSDADGIMDWLDERGIIDQEWQKIKDMMKDADNLEMRAKNSNDDED